MNCVVAMCRRGVLNSKSKHFMLFLPFGCLPKISANFGSRIAQNITMNICGPSNCEFHISKLIYIIKQTNKRGGPSLWRLPGTEITSYAAVAVQFVGNSEVRYGIV